MKIKAIRKPSITIAYLSASKPYVLRFSVGLFALSGIVVAAYLFMPMNVAYAYSGDNCVSKPTLLPRLHKQNSGVVRLTDKRTVTLFGYPLMATKTCLSMTTMLPEGQPLAIKRTFLNVPFLAQSYTITPTAYPVLLAAAAKQIQEPIPVDGAVELLLNKPDEHFRYKVILNDARSDCEIQSIRLTCNLANQNLKHKETYTAKLVRGLNDQSTLVDDIVFTTVDPIAVTGQSVAQDARVQTKLESLIITTDRAVGEIKGVVLKSGTDTYEVTTTIQESSIIVKLPSNLPRDKTYDFTIDTIRGTRGEKNTAPFAISFYLTPGPQVTGMSIGDRAVPANTSIAVRFDQSLAIQNHATKIVLKQNNKRVESRIVTSGTTLTIQPNTALERCAELTIEVNGIFENTHGIANEVYWRGTSRVTCATSFSIGQSVEGRAMIGYSFGSGNREIVYIGTTHGDEGNTKRLLDKWIYELEGNPGKIPAGTTVTVLPLINPDGFARTSRFNARNVDLNRNFPANNWKSDIVIQGGQLVAKGGGETALSEPESQAIAAYIQRMFPAMVVTYHSKGGIVESNEAGNANSVARQYASRAGYGYKEASSNVGFFNYDVNGSLEEWAKDSLSQPVLLVELESKTNDEFSSNKNAMWGLL